MAARAKGDDEVEKAAEASLWFVETDIVADLLFLLQYFLAAAIAACALFKTCLSSSLTRRVNSWK